MNQVPPVRIRKLNDAPIEPDSQYVLYWMIANRRVSWNYSLDRAIEWCNELGKPLVVLEAIRSDYEWASDRIHRFVMQGMAENRIACANSSVRYYAYVEPELGNGAGLVEALAANAAVVVTDDFPCFFLPKMTHELSQRVEVSVETVDSNGILPMRSADRIFSRAFDFRRWLQKNLNGTLTEAPLSDPLHRLPQSSPYSIPQTTLDRWPEAPDEQLVAGTEQLATLPIDHHVAPAVFDGGATAATQTLDRFLHSRFPRYADHRNDPDNEAASGLSPYLHFGHISSHEVFHRIVDQENWSPDSLGQSTRGARQGWWGMSHEAENFLDELITWRELGFNMCWQSDQYDQYESLPDWAKNSLAKHASDPREYLYEASQFEFAETHDALWNAAQRQLVREGRMHNYMRMLWGKKILEWSASPQAALETMIHLNNKYAVDGRNPNSYSGIFWVLGRYDRAWGPERPIYGKIRYMSSENTARKIRVKNYLQRYGATVQLQPSFGSVE